MNPLVVMVGPGLDGMEQVAASLGRKGVETAWIGYPYEPRRVLRTRLFTDHSTSAATVPELSGALRRLDPSRIVDVVSSEYVAADLIRAARAADLPADLLERMERTYQWTDKLVVHRALEAAGINVPTALDAGETTAAEAVERLGLPLVVKGRIGLAGTSVRIVHSLADAERAAVDLEQFGGVYFEKAVRGQDHAYVATYADGGRVIQDGSYISERSTADVTGPPDLVTGVDRPEQRRAGAAAIGVIGGRGMLNMDFITDESGREWLLDVNIRPWHSTVTWRSVGIDFVDGYVHALGLGPVPDGPRQLPVGRSVRVYPRVAANALRQHPVAASRELVQQTREHLPWTGPGYVAAAMFRVVGIVGANASRELRERRERRRASAR